MACRAAMGDIPWKATSSASATASGRQKTHRFRPRSTSTKNPPARRMAPK